MERITKRISSSSSSICWEEGDVLEIVTGELIVLWLTGKVPSVSSSSTIWLLDVNYWETCRTGTTEKVITSVEPRWWDAAGCRSRWCTPRFVTSPLRPVSYHHHIVSLVIIKDKLTDKTQMYERCEWDRNRRKTANARLLTMNIFSGSYSLHSRTGNKDSE